MQDVADFITGKVGEHSAYFRDSIPMIASENVMSPTARRVYNSDLMDRYAEGLPYKRYYQGNQHFDPIEEKAIELAKQLFDCNHADVRPISGTVANSAVLYALAEPGDTICTPHVSAGGHISATNFGAVGMRGLKIQNYPWNVETMNLEVDGAAKLIRETAPKICLFGRSVFLFPPPLDELTEVAKEVGAKVWFDAAHVLGLIAHGRFCDPLRQGVDVISGSTHKTLPGPQHGIILGNVKRKTRGSLSRRVFPGVTSNHHLHAVAALGVTLAEHIQFGADYADQIIKNAQILAEALASEGFTVLGEAMGYTRSHALVMDVTAQGGGRSCAETLETAHIVTNKNLLPWDDNSKSQDPSGIRLGTQEMTRIGMKEDDMKQVAEFFRELLIDGTDVVDVRHRVVEFKSRFQTVHYCLEPGPAYE